MTRFIALNNLTYHTPVDDDDDEYFDDDDDMDGLDIDLGDLMEASAGTITEAEGSEIINLKRSIIRGGLERGETPDMRTFELQDVGTTARGLPKNSKMYVNDIDGELNGRTSTFTYEDEEVTKAPIQTSSKRLKLSKSISSDLASVQAIKKDKKVAMYLDVTGEAAHTTTEEKLADGETLMTQGEFQKSLADDSVCICQRCFKLQQYGTVEDSLRPGWSDHELLTPERFESLLACIRETEAVVLCIVDVFDLKGSLLANLKQIAGKNPIVIAANKVDLLPRDVSTVRLTSWIHSEVKEYCDLRSPKEVEDSKRQEMIAQGWHRPGKGDDEGLLRRSNVHLVSCQSGVGMDDLMGSLMGLATDNGNKVSVGMRFAWEINHFVILLSPFLFINLSLTYFLLVTSFFSFSSIYLNRYITCTLFIQFRFTLWALLMWANHHLSIVS